MVGSEACSDGSDGGRKREEVRFRRQRRTEIQKQGRQWRNSRHSTRGCGRRHMSLQQAGRRRLALVHVADESRAGRRRCRWQTRRRDRIGQERAGASWRRQGEAGPLAERSERQAVTMDSSDRTRTGKPELARADRARHKAGMCKDDCRREVYVCRGVGVSLSVGVCMCESARAAQSPASGQSGARSRPPVHDRCTT